jgi:hypothetical protein
MKKFEQTLTLPLRPFVVDQLQVLHQRTQATMLALGTAPAIVARVNVSLLLRNLIKRGTLTAEAVRLALGQHIDKHGVIEYRVRVRRGMLPPVNRRLRLTPALMEALNDACKAATVLVPDYPRIVSQARTVAALILTAAYRDGPIPDVDHDPPMPAAPPLPLTLVS